MSTSLQTDFSAWTRLVEGQIMCLSTNLGSI